MGTKMHTPDDEDREDPERDAAPRYPEERRPFASLSDFCLRLTLGDAERHNKPKCAGWCRRELELRGVSTEALARPLRGQAR